MDITINTKRFTRESGFAGATNNDLIRIAAQALDYACEIDTVDGQVRRDIPVAYCVYQAWHRTEIVRASQEKMMANVIERIRDDVDSLEIYDDSFTFGYAGMTFRIMTEDVYQAQVDSAVENMLDEAQYELDSMKDKHLSYISNYVTIDEAQFKRDIEYDSESLVSYYDGQVHEMSCNEHGDGDGNVVTRRETLYMIRED